MADFLNVENVLTNLDLKDSMLAAEFGCGSAAFAVAMAKKLAKGRVYALDIQEEKLSALNGRAKHENLRNILTVLCDLEVAGGSKLPNGTLDVVLITNLLFQAENKHIILEEAKRVLKKGGQLLVVDWLKEGPFSPRPEGRGSPSGAAKTGMIKPEELKAMAENLEFFTQKEFAVGDYHYGLLFVKQ